MAMPVMPAVSMVNVESSPVPTCNSKQVPSAAIEDIDSPSSTTVHPASTSASMPPSRSCMVSSVGESVGMSTSHMVGSA